MPKDKSEKARKLERAKRKLARAQRRVEEAAMEAKAAAMDKKREDERLIVADDGSRTNDRGNGNGGDARRDWTAKAETMLAGLLEEASAALREDGFEGVRRVMQDKGETMRRAAKVKRRSRRARDDMDNDMGVDDDFDIDVNIDMDIDADMDMDIDMDAEKEAEMEAARQATRRMAKGIGRDVATAALTAAAAAFAASAARGGSKRRSGPGGRSRKDRDCDC
ncbi:MAG: hypothetical protein AAF205_11555 [Pseudomonadota bacterium]